MRDDAAAFSWGAITTQIGTANNDMLQDCKDIDTDKVRLEMNKIFYFRSLIMIFQGKDFWQCSFILYKTLNFAWCKLGSLWSSKIHESWMYFPKSTLLLLQVVLILVTVWAIQLRKQLLQHQMHDLTFYQFEIILKTKKILLVIVTTITTILGIICAFKYYFDYITIKFELISIFPNFDYDEFIIVTIFIV